MRTKEESQARRRTYLSWRDMCARCRPTNKDYRHYGGRGITVCARWLESFENFLADMGERSEGQTLDRINNDGNYEPSNCRWATRKEQRLNQRPTKGREGLPPGISGKDGHWRAYVYVREEDRRRQIHLGTFKTPEQAAAAVAAHGACA